MRIVIDTNVLISAVIGTSPQIKAVLDVCRTGQTTLVISKPLLTELGRVLHKPKLQAIHRMSDVEISRYIKTLSSFAELVPGKTLVEVTTDATDNLLFSCALEGKADYIVSGDKKHVLPVDEYRGIHTISPHDFIEQVVGAEKA